MVSPWVGLGRGTVPAQVAKSWRWAVEPPGTVIIGMHTLLPAVPSKVKDGKYLANQTYHVAARLQDQRWCVQSWSCLTNLRTVSPQCQGRKHCEESLVGTAANIPALTVRCGGVLQPVALRLSGTQHRSSSQTPCQLQRCCCGVAFSGSGLAPFMLGEQKERSIEIFTLDPHTARWPSAGSGWIVLHAGRGRLNRQAGSPPPSR